MQTLRIVLLGASLLANVYLLFSSSPWVNHTPPAAHATVDDPKTRDVAPKPAIAPEIVQAIRNGDASAVQKLKELGLPDHLVRAYVAAEISALYEDRMNAVRPDPKKIPFWSSEKTQRQLWSPEVRTKLAELGRERNALLKQVLGSDYAPPNRWRDVQTYPLPAAKAELVQMLEEDYNTMQQEIRPMGGVMVTLPEDVEKLAYLEKERRQELTSLLSPSELFEYDLRNSDTARQLRYELQAFNPTEAEFREMFKIAQDISLKLGPNDNSPEYFEKRQKLLAESEPQFKGLLGDDRFQELKQARDYDYRRLNQIAQRLNLPPEKFKEVIAIRNSADEQLRSPEARNSATRQEFIAALATRTEARLTAILGAEATELYKKNGSLFRRFTPPPPRSTRTP